MKPFYNILQTGAKIPSCPIIGFRGIPANVEHIRIYSFVSVVDRTRRDTFILFLNLKDVASDVVKHSSHRPQ